MASSRSIVWMNTLATQVKQTEWPRCSVLGHSRILRVHSIIFEIFGHKLYERNSEYSAIKVEIEEKWTVIPYIDEVMSLARDRQRSQETRAEKFFHNQVTNESNYQRYTLNQMGRMMGNLYELTGKIHSPRVSTIESVSSPSPRQTPATMVTSRTPEQGPMARQIHVFAKQRPELQMSTTTNSVDLLETKRNIPSIVERYRLYQTIWRGSPSLYKKRSVIINFIESLLRQKAFHGAIRMQLGILLDLTRDKRHLSALCADIA